jgi:hypothetical protein
MITLGIIAGLEALIIVGLTLLLLKEKRERKLDLSDFVTIMGFAEKEFMNLQNEFVALTIKPQDISKKTIN